MKKNKLISLIMTQCIIISPVAYNICQPPVEQNMSAYAYISGAFEFLKNVNSFGIINLEPNEIETVKTVGDHIEDCTITFTIQDENIAKIVKVNGTSVDIIGVSTGETILSAETSKGEKATIKVIVPEKNGIYFSKPYLCSIDYIELDSPNAIFYATLMGCESGESNIKFSIDNENIAKITEVKGTSVYGVGVTPGETILRAETSDGQTAEIKIVVPSATTTVAIETTPSENYTTTVDLCGDIYTSYICGDVNSDFKVSISDAVSILQYLANNEKYPLSEQEIINADCCNKGDGITGLDAAAIQKLDAGIIDKLPEVIS